MKIENREEKKKDREKGSGFGSLEYIHLPVKRSHHSIHRLAEHISQNSSRLWSCRCCMTSTTPGVGSPIDAVIGPANMFVPSERCPSSQSQKQRVTSCCQLQTAMNLTFVQQVKVFFSPFQRSLASLVSIGPISSKSTICRRDTAK